MYATRIQFLFCQLYDRTFEILNSNTNKLLGVKRADQKKLLASTRYDFHKALAKEWSRSWLDSFTIETVLEGPAHMTHVTGLRSSHLYEFLKGWLDGHTQQFFREIMVRKTNESDGVWHSIFLVHTLLYYCIKILHTSLFDMDKCATFDKNEHKRRKTQLLKEQKILLSHITDKFVRSIVNTFIHPPNESNTMIDIDKPHATCWISGLCIALCHNHAIYKREKHIHQFIRSFLETMYGCDAMFDLIPPFLIWNNLVCIHHHKTFVSHYLKSTDIWVFLDAAMQIPSSTMLEHPIRAIEISYNNNPTMLSLRMKSTVIIDSIRQTCNFQFHPENQFDKILMKAAIREFKSLLFDWLSFPPFPLMTKKEEKEETINNMKVLSRWCIMCHDMGGQMFLQSLENNIRHCSIRLLLLWLQHFLLLEPSKILSLLHPILLKLEEVATSLFCFSQPHTQQREFSSSIFVALCHETSLFELWKVSLSSNAKDLWLYTDFCILDRDLLKECFVHLKDLAKRLYMLAIGGQFAELDDLVKNISLRSMNNFYCIPAVNMLCEQEIRHVTVSRYLSHLISAFRKVLVLPPQEGYRLSACVLPPPDVFGLDLLLLSEIGTITKKPPPPFLHLAFGDDFYLQPRRSFVGDYDQMYQKHVCWMYEHYTTVVRISCSDGSLSQNFRMTSIQLAICKMLQQQQQQGHDQLLDALGIDECRLKQPLFNLVKSGLVVLVPPLSSSQMSYYMFQPSFQDTKDMIDVCSGLYDQEQQQQPQKLATAVDTSTCRRKQEEWMSSQIDAFIVRTVKHAERMEWNDLVKQTSLAPIVQFMKIGPRVQRIQERIESLLKSDFLFRTVVDQVTFIHYQV